MKLYIYNSYETLFNFSLNREFRKYIKNPNDPAAKARWNYVLSGKNNSLTDFRKGGAVRHNKDGSIDHIKSSDERMNDMIKRMELAQNMAEKRKFDGNILSAVDHADYIDDSGNSIHAIFNQPSSHISGSDGRYTMKLRNPQDKFHEAAHMKQQLKARFNKLKSQGIVKPHSTYELQQLEGITDLYGMQAHNNWLRLKTKSKKKIKKPIDLIKYRNKLEYDRKTNYMKKLAPLQGTPLYNSEMNKIKANLPDNIQNNMNGYFQAKPDEQLEYTEPGLYDILSRAQNSNESPGELLNLLHI